MSDLTELRHEAADHEFENYEFGSANVGEADGWEYQDPGLRYERTVWFENQDAGGPDIKGTFMVSFASLDSAEIADVRAMINGEDIGQRPVSVAIKL